MASEHWTEFRRWKFSSAASKTKNHFIFLKTWRDSGFHGLTFVVAYHRGDGIQTDLYDDNLASFPLPVLACQSTGSQEILYILQAIGRVAFMYKYILPDGV